MTTEAAGAQTTEPTKAGSSPGQMLRRQREERGLSLQDVADELHLDRRVVETIEADRFVALGAPVYAKGHLRKYAQLLELSPQAVLASYESLSEGARLATVTLVPAVTAPPDDRRSSMWIALAALAVCVVALTIWQVVQPPVETETSERASAEAAVVGSETAVAPDPVAAVESAAGVVAPAAMSETQSASIPATQTTVELQLAFREPSWVEVYDSTGDKLMFDTGQPESPRKLSGSAPLTVLLGKASAVQVAVNGEHIVVPVQPGRNAARFTVNADATVR